MAWRKNNILGSRGDTLVEVLLATVVISITLSGAFTLSNKASSLNQQSYDRTRASSLAQKQAELARSARDTYDENGPSSQNWARIKSISQATSSHRALGAQCDTLSSLQSSRGSSNVYYIDDNNAFVNSVAEGTDTIFTVWSESVRGLSDGYYDIYTYVCWDGVGTQHAQKLVVVLRLEENDD